jgi:hypothetical protein
LDDNMNNKFEREVFMALIKVLRQIILEILSKTKKM